MSTSSPDGQTGSNHDQVHEDQGQDDAAYESTRSLAYPGDDTPDTTPPPEAPEAAPPEARPPLIGIGQHLAAIVLALVCTPVALVLVDYGYGRWTRSLSTFQVANGPDARAVAAMACAAVLLFLIAWLAKMSPLGPLCAGVVWGAVPWVFITFYSRDVMKHVVDLPDLYDSIGRNVIAYGFVTYALIAALLIGAGLGASWRRAA